MVSAGATSNKRRQSLGNGFTRIDVRPVSGALGAEILGVDLNQADEETIEQIHRAFLQYHVIFFRDQSLSIDSHKDFARRFGTLNIHPQYVPLKGHPEVLSVTKEPLDIHNVGGVWHSDLTFLERPPMGSILYALEVPDRGGDTQFANQMLAYESLTEACQNLLSGLRALHSDRGLSERKEAQKRNATRSLKIAESAMDQPPVANLHPVVRTHPQTGRKSLFANRAFTIHFEDMTEEESRSFLNFLYEHAVKPEFTCRFRWKKHSIAMWDNRCVQHYALNDYAGKRRHMHRVTVDGDKPF